MKKNYFAVIMLTVLVLCATACGDDDNDNASRDSNLIGTWLDIDEGTYETLIYGWRFKKDGTCQDTDTSLPAGSPIVPDWSDYKQEWSTKDGIIYIKYYEDGEVDILRLRYRFENNKKTLFVVDIDDEKDYENRLEKQ